MKKIICIICILILAFSVSFGTIAAFADTYEEESDLVFRNALEDILVYEEVSAETIMVTKEPLYDMDLVQMGYLYLMEYDFSEGFAIVINTTGSFDVVEFYMTGENPYTTADCLYVYSNMFQYLIWQDDAFFDAQTGVELDAELVDELSAEALYSYGSTIEMGTDVIYYNYRNQTSDYLLAIWYPKYVYTPNSSNACVAVAGGNVIGFYDRDFTNLIPNYEPGTLIFGTYQYNGLQTSTVSAVIDTLAVYMGTNTNGAGTTIAGFKTGMTRYTGEKNRSISYSSCMSSGNLNFNTVKQKLNNGLPVVLFVDCFYVAEIAELTGRDSLGYISSVYTHAMAGFGYREITYTLTNGQSRTDKYIAVATGLGNQTSGYYNTNYNTQIDECLAINIY